MEHSEFADSVGVEWGIYAAGSANAILLFLDRSGFEIATPKQTDKFCVVWGKNIIQKCQNTSDRNTIKFKYLP